MVESYLTESNATTTCGPKNNNWLDVLEMKRPHRVGDTAFSKLIPATTYVPTQLPVQYHRPGEA
jgi:hypothetical protein